MDDTGTKAQNDRLEHLGHGLPNGDTPDPEGDAPSDVPINENLFLDEDLDEELENLDLDDE